MFDPPIPLWYGMVCNVLFTCIWFHHEDAVVIKQLQVFVTYSLGGVHTPPKRLRYKPMERDYKATLPPASLLVYYTAVLLSMDLTYATAAYAYGKPIQAQSKQFKRDDLLEQATQRCQR